MSYISRFPVCFVLLFLIFAVPAKSDDRSSDKEHGSGKTLTPRIESISPASAFEDQSVTITGSDFDARGLHVTVGGLPAEVLNFDSHTVTFRVPERAVPGGTEVIVKNQGGNTASIAFTVLEHVSPAVACDDDEHRHRSTKGRDQDRDRDDRIIRCLAPIAARRGEQVSVELRSFEDFGFRLKLNDLPLTVISDGRKRLTFVVPQSAASGSAIISITNRQGETSGMAFTVLEGILLPGNPSTPAIVALFDKAPTGADQSQIQDNVILTRLDLRLASNATVSQVNGALQQVNGGIVSMARGLPGVTISVPLQPSIFALEQLSSELQGMPGIESSTIGHQPGLMSLPFTPSTSPNLLDESAHLLPARFPAGWNASALLKGCTPLPVLIADYFGAVPQGFGAEIPTFLPAQPFAGTLSEAEAAHGYENALLVAAALDAGSVPGTDPFPECLDVRLIQVAGLTDREKSQTIADGFPQGRFIVNYSLGYNDDCFRQGATPLESTFDCQSPIDVTIVPPLDRAKDALSWKEFTSGRWGDFLATTSAGNSADAPSAAIYGGVNDSRYTNMISISAQPDPFFDFTVDPTLWDPSPNFPQFDTLVPSPSDRSNLQNDATAKGLDHSVASNSLVVGGTTSLPTQTLLTVPAAPDGLDVTSDSEANSQVKAVSENIFNDENNQGTSYAAPQVAGLASYLWLLSPKLRQLPPSVTVQDIIANSWSEIGSATGLIDAYATVLSLDSPGPISSPGDAPIRLAILDVNDDGVFDENDLTLFLKHYFTVDANGDLTNVQSSPTTVDYGRFDLNGDGFTGGSTRQRFDLDRIGSTQFGQTVYSEKVPEEVEGVQISFDESALTDLQIFCYYAYSPLYQGDTGQRTNILGGYCFPIQVQVNPASATLAVGATQQFSATVHGSNDPRVNWSVDGIRGGNSTVGTISTSGLYTAAGAGSHTIRATSVVDSTAFDEASVTITGSCSPGNFNYQHYFLANPVQVIDSDYFTSGSTHSDQLPEASINVGYGSITATASGSNFFPYNPASGNGTHDGGAESEGQFQDEIIVMPSDPTLNGKPANITISFQVTVTPQISGDRAGSSWSANIGFPWQFNKSGHISSVAGQDTGDANGGTYSVTAPDSFYTSLGTPITLSGTLFASVGFECLFNQTCPDSASQGLTGAANINASFAWKGMTVRDQAGRPVSFTVCSASGKNWATP